MLKTAFEMIDELDNRVRNMEYINSQEFICDLLRTVDYSKDEIDENKRIMYAKYLTACCHIDNAENRCKRMFLELMEKIDGLDFYILKSLKLPTVNWLSDPLWAKVSVIISITWRWTGYNAIIILAGLQAVDHSIIESAIVDGAGPRTVFFKIIVPMLKPVLLFCAIMSTNGTLQLFTEPFILFPPYGSGPANSTQTVITYLYQNGFQGFKFGLASAGAYVIAGIIVLLSLIQMKFTKGGEI